MLAELQGTAELQQPTPSVFSITFARRSRFHRSRFHRSRHSNSTMSIIPIITFKAGKCDLDVSHLLALCHSLDGQ